MAEYTIQPSPSRVRSSISSAVPGYAQGLWTPSVSDTGTPATYVEQFGSYTIIGNLCFVSGSIQINTMNDGIRDTITGLPFPARTSNISFTRDLFHCWWNGTVDGVGAVRNLVYMVGQSQEETRNIILYSLQAADDVLTTWDVMGDGTAIQFSGTYQVDTD